MGPPRGHDPAPAVVVRRVAGEARPSPAQARWHRPRTRPQRLPDAAPERTPSRSGAHAQGSTGIGSSAQGRRRAATPARRRRSWSSPAVCTTRSVASPTVRFELEAELPNERGAGAVRTGPFARLRLPVGRANARQRLTPEIRRTGRVRGPIAAGSPPWPSLWLWPLPWPLFLERLA